MMDCGARGRCTARGCSHTPMATSTYCTCSIRQQRKGKKLTEFLIILRYDGDFQNDMKEGYGVLIYSNGEKYEVSHTVP